MNTLRFSLLLAAAAAAVVGCSVARADNFKLSSPDVSPDRPIAAAQVYAGFGCHGGNHSPALSWHGAPAGTQSFALTVYDPDAPTGSGWWHWVLVDIPSTVNALPADAGAVGGDRAPAGSHAVRNDFGTRGYGGPCPPAGDAPHRYEFTLYALDSKHLDLPADASPAMAGFVIHSHALGEARLTARYGR